MLLTIIVPAGGCGDPGPPRGTIRGQVTYNGQPLSSGSVVFDNPQLGVSQVATLQPDGTYEMSTHHGRGIRVGSYRVAIKPDSIGSGEAPLAANPAQAGAPSSRSSIPPKYGHPATSPLSIVVKEGKNPDADFKLVD